MSNSLLSRSIGYADLARHAKGARSKSRDEVAASKSRTLLAERMGRLRGLPQKIGQMLSMSDDAAVAEPFSDLTDAGEPLSFDSIETVLINEWGGQIEDRVATIDKVGLAASIGQVHRATLQDGRVVAIKVQYPEISAAVNNDLRVLGWLSIPVGDLRRGFDLAGYRNEIRRDLETELDYHAEAFHQNRMRAVLRDVDGWIVPEVVDSLSTERVLVSAWEAGDGIDCTASWSESERKLLARRIIAGFMEMIFGAGFIHSDPHPGNYRFRRGQDGPEIVLYDFGCVFEMPLKHRLQILKLIQMTIDQSGDPYKPLVELGFNPDLLMPIRQKLPAVCRVLFEPFALGGQSQKDKWNIADRIEDILGSDKWNFRMAGPPWMIWLLRAFRGLSYYLDRLDMGASWANATKPYLVRHAAELASIDVSSPDSKTGFEGQAKYLKIKVTQDYREKVALTFPASSVDDLELLMEGDLRERLIRDGYKIDEMVRTVRRNGYRPQSIFNLELVETGKRAAVWLE